MQKSPLAQSWTTNCIAIRNQQRIVCKVYQFINQCLKFKSVSVDLADSSKTYTNELYSHSMFPSEASSWLDAHQLSMADSIQAAAAAVESYTTKVHE